MKKLLFFAGVLGAGAAGALASCAAETHSNARWYSTAQVATGEQLYATHCLSCHGAGGVGAEHWRVRGADGLFPPPPLNGSAHTWHHSLAVLRQTIDSGGASFGGAMPAFRGKLNNKERDAVIAHFQSWWPDEIYQTWEEKVQKSGGH